MSEWCSEAEAIARAEIRFPGVPSIAAAALAAIRGGEIKKRGGGERIRRHALDFVPVLNPGQNYEGLIDDYGRSILETSPIEINVRDLEAWLARMAGSIPDATIELASEKSAQWAATARGVHELWNGTVPAGLTNGRRDEAIQTFAKEHALAVPSARTIRRFFSGQ